MNHPRQTGHIHCCPAALLGAAAHVGREIAVTGTFQIVRDDVISSK